MMFFCLNLKERTVIILSILFLCSCNIIGGDDEKQVSENSVLSGPPLAIPPEFDVDSPQNSTTNQEEESYDFLEPNDLENDNFNDNIVYDDDQLNQVTSTNNNLENQSFENLNSFNQNNVPTQINKNSNIRKKIISKRSSVPSDAYNFNTSTLSKKNTYAKKKSDNFSGFGNQNFEQMELQNSSDLSNEEELLLDDILNQSDNQSDSPLNRDFESTGDAN